MTASAPAAAAPHTHEKKTRVPWWKTRAAKITGRVCLVIFIVGLIVWWFKYRPYVSTDDARVAATLVRVAPEGISGRIEKVNVTEGSRVKKDDVLVELDHRVTAAQLEKAKVRAEVTAKDLTRSQQLARQSGLPQRDLDRAMAEAQGAEADLKLAETAYDNTFLKSPVDGIVVQKIAEVGNILEAGQTAVTVADVDHAWIAANVEETSVGKVKIGQPVDISVDEGGELKGKVSEIRAAAASQFALIPSDNAAGNFTKLVQRIPIKVEIENHGDKILRPGQSVEIKIRVID